VANLPLSETAAKLRRDEYVLDSAHHGLALDPAGEKLCVAGTMAPTPSAAPTFPSA
jgi:hypothetical protein